MPRPIFTARVRSNPFGVFTLNDFETTQIGTSPTGTPEDASSSSDNAVIQVKNDLYFVGGGVLYKYNKVSTAWDILYHPIGMPTTNRTNSGIHLINLSGVPYLCWIIGLVTSGFYRGIKYNLNTGVATETTQGSLQGWSTGKKYSIVYNNSIFLGITPGNLYAIVYNPSTETLASITVVASIGAANGSPNAHFCVWNKNLYSIAKANASDLYLVRYTGSSFINVASVDINANLPATTATAHNYCIFTDKTYLYVFYLNASNNTRCMAFDANLNRYDISTLVMPTTFTQSAVASRIWSYIDSEDDIINPDIFFWAAHSATAGTAVTKYKWNGSGNMMTPVGIGGDLAHSFSSSQEGAGHRSWTSNELDILITSTAQSTVPGATRIAFNIYESALLPSGTPVYVRMAYDADFEHCTSFATLSNPLPSGTIVNNNTITGIVAGSGINYSVDWKPTLNMIAPNTIIRLVPMVSGVV